MGNDTETRWFWNTNFFQKHTKHRRRLLENTLLKMSNNHLNTNHLSNEALLRRESAPVNKKKQEVKVKFGESIETTAPLSLDGEKKEQAEKHPPVGVTDGSCEGKCGHPSCANIEIIHVYNKKGGEELRLAGNVASKDYLKFQFRNRRYRDQITDAVQRTHQLCAVSCHVKGPSDRRILWLAHHFDFMGGSLGCAEGEVLVQGFEYAREHRIPVVVECRSGGARIQEGTLSLMQMAKVSVAVQALHNASIPFISLAKDPTYGGVSASYAMQSDIRIALKTARVGFAGPNVILNTVFNKDHDAYDEKCPQGFQTAPFLKKHGQVDIVVESEEEAQNTIDDLLDILWYGKAVDKRRSSLKHLPRSNTAEEIAALAGSVASLNIPSGKISEDVLAAAGLSGYAVSPGPVGPSPLMSPLVPVSQQVLQERLERKDYTKVRNMDRYQAQDFVAALFENFVELSGDGRYGSDVCMRGGLGFLGRRPVAVIGMWKGHTEVEMHEANHGMPSPHGYRFALRVMKMAQHFDLPVVTLVDTVGAFPSFDSEIEGQFEAIATNLREMSGLKIPIVSVIIGEGGSGGALGVAMGNRVGMLRNGWYSVISPEGGASILGRYTSDEHKAQQFPLDCHILARAGHVYAEQLFNLGAIDEIIDEPEGKPDFKEMDIVRDNVKRFVARSLVELSAFSPKELVDARYRKFRSMGKFDILDMETRHNLMSSPRVAHHRAPRVPKEVAAPLPDCPTLKFIASQTLHSTQSKFRGLYPKGVTVPSPLHSINTALPSTSIRPVSSSVPVSSEEIAQAVALAESVVKPVDMPPTTENAKSILDSAGPEAVAAWVRKQKRCLITDTTMRDAHQSLLATRMRTVDMLGAAPNVSRVLHDAFSLECWGGATFDVAHRFLHECPWDRLRKLRQLIPNICLQMLVRSNNVVGYTNYPSNLVTRFVEVAAKTGVDVFRIFDCFNNLDQMQLTIDAVRKSGKIAEVCMCFSGDFLNPNEKIYTLDYYREMTRKIVDAGAHLIAIKDMAGLLKPQMAKPIMEAIRSITDLPVHFHTHNTSSAALTTCVKMAEAGCDIIDFATAALSDTTSQPSLNAFLACMEGSEWDPKINYLSLEPIDMYWDQVRSVYRPLDSSAPMQSGSARVYDHQIPGGQYSNLLVQCKSLGLYDRWAEIVDMYRDVNKLLGDVIKVTPSSKVIGDLALYLIKGNLTVEDLRTRGDQIEWPQSVIDFCRGKIGFPHRGIPEEVQRMVLHGETVSQTKPKVLPPLDLEMERAQLIEKYGHHVNDTELVSALLYPLVHPKFVKMQEDYGKGLPYIPSVTFFYGMEVGESLTFKMPAICDPTLVLNADLNGTVEATIVLKKVGKVLPDATRLFTFEVNGVQRTVTIKDETLEKKKVKALKADPDDPAQLASPLPGNVDKVCVQPGDTVGKGDVIIQVGAMKMEVQITCPFPRAIVQKVCVKQDMRVDTGSLLAVLKPIEG